MVGVPTARGHRRAPEFQDLVTLFSFQDLITLFSFQVF